MRFKKACLFPLLALLGFSTHAQTLPTENALLWKVTGPGMAQPSYLFGTYHLMSGSYLNDHKLLKKLIKKSKLVVGELVQQEGLQALMMQHAMLGGDTTLQSLLTPAQYDSVDAFYRQVMGGGSVSAFNKFRPAMVSQTISVQILVQETGRSLADLANSLDMSIQTLAREKGIETRGLETPADQIHALFYSSTNERQAQKILELVDEVPKLRSVARRLDSCYMAQNLECLQQLLLESDLDETESRALLVERNNAWVPKLVEWFRQQPTFVAVGALHLSGDTGLVRQLRARGYTVQPIRL
jgi:hypothetical protein